MILQVYFGLALVSVVEFAVGLAVVFIVLYYIYRLIRQRAEEEAK